MLKKLVHQFLVFKLNGNICPKINKKSFFPSTSIFLTFPFTFVYIYEGSDFNEISTASTFFWN